jgi:protein O-GlcNAc transferase
MLTATCGKNGVKNQETMSDNNPNSATMTIEQAFNLALQHHQAGRLQDAQTIYRQILNVQPNHSDALNLLGVIASQMGQHKVGTELISRAISINPAEVIYYINLGIALQKLGSGEAAISACREAIKLQPDYAEAYNNLGVSLKDQGQLDAAIAAYRKTIQLKPDYDQAWSNLIYTLQFHPGYDDKAIYEEQLRWRKRYADPLKKFVQPHTNPDSHRDDPERRLKIGYVSPDFFSHSQSFFTLPLLEAHNHQQFEIHCYANVSLPDHKTDRIRRSADVWHNVVGKTHSELAEHIRSDQIDILIDLTMHMANSRLLVFARKPAPIQVTWLAYPGSTGLDTIDYRLTDPYLDPPELDDAYYSEKSFRLPDTFWCYDPLTDQPSINELPAIKNSYVTFGCLNNFCKVNDGVLRLWAKVLTAIPNSRLILLAPQGHARRQVLDTFGKNGVEANRVEFVDFQQRPEYLKLYHKIDLGLDTQPYNGHTTSLDSFWMGVPVATLVGQTVVGRAGWSQLCNLGLKDLAAQTSEEYVKIAVKLADDLPRLVQLRSTLRSRMQTSPLMDIKRFAQNIESVYRFMWRKWATKSTI